MYYSDGRLVASGNFKTSQIKTMNVLSLPKELDEDHFDYLWRKILSTSCQTINECSIQIEMKQRSKMKLTIR